MPASEIMHKFKAGTLKSGSGAKVTNPAQARAIAASYGRKEHSMAGLPDSLRIETDAQRKARKIKQNTAARASAKKAAATPAREEGLLKRAGRDIRGAAKYTADFYIKPRKRSENSSQVFQRTQINRLDRERY